MRYDLIRLVMLQNDSLDLFGSGNSLNRESWLRNVFADPIEFLHYGSVFHYVPEGQGRVIIGKVGRRFQATENSPPEGGLEEIEHEGWKAAAVIIDPTAHEDGQKVAMQIDARVGNPLSVFKSLCESINRRSPAEPYIIVANAIVDPETFWLFERENRGDITFVSFELVAPNMFGTRNDIDREMKELRENERVRKATLDLQNSDGLNLDTSRVRETVNYTLEGGGAITARTKTKKRFSSKKKAKQITVVDLTDQDESFLSKVHRAIVRMFP